MKKIIALCIGLMALVQTSSAQNWCGSVEQRNEMYADRPEDAARLKARFEAFNQQVKQSKTNVNDNFVIPVVFHVIHEGGDENVSLAQIEDQIRVVNEDFARLNPDTNNTPSVFAAYAGVANIEFRLAKIDPNGNCTQGVTRTYSSLTNDARNNVKDLVQWNPYKYLNVWVVKSIENFSEDGGMVLGFAQFPDQLWEDADTDGIVLRHDYCGSIESANGAVGRTLTHEVGHWLNLIHIWGDQDCGDDNVDDTPTSQEPNYGVCDTNGDANGGAFPYHVQNCSASPGQTIPQENGEMFMNYMDYSDDQCMNMFTIGQIERMHNAITTYRPVLVSEANLEETGTNDDYEDINCQPIAHFATNETIGCSGSEFSFSDLSYNTDSNLTYEWEFENGSPSTSTEQNPIVSFNEEGEWDVSLTVTSSEGTSSSTISNHIMTTDFVSGELTPYFETFESSSFPNNANDELDWTIEAPSNSDSWQRTTAASSPNVSPITANGLNSASIRIRTSDFDSNDEIHTLTTPSIDLSNISNGESIRAYFDIAYAKKTLATNDNLSIYISNDCGRIWSKRADLDSDELSTIGTSTSLFDFVPESDEWSEENINLNSNRGNENVRIKFELSGSNGNWFYIDNFVVCKITDLNMDESQQVGVDIYPNPSKGDATIDLYLNENSDVKLSLQNMIGAVIFDKTISLTTGTNKLQLSELHSGINTGVYSLSIKVNNRLIIEKIVISE